MLTHGREPGAFCHLSLTGIWPGDPNFTVTSLAKCLRDLEQNTVDSDHTGDLSRTSSRTPLFRSLLDQTAFRATMGNEGAVDSTYIRQYGCEDRLQVPAGQTDTTSKKLPPTFMLQMDNSAKDNKNIHVLAFCSELVIRGVFENVETDHGTGFKLDYENREATGVDNNDSVTWMDELDKELDEENAVQLQPYIGVPSERPKRAFVPLEDISEGRFVVLRPDDAFEAEVPRAVWLGRCMGSVARDTSDEQSWRISCRVVEAKASEIHQCY
ncbi:hypothetical protein R1sor_026521 [Riccia sorocarpa]|uniref:DUF7869 domain-containing protein n=1 Tax=Riccia sorocarpa TaxID=122646 RepID=A0ABD3GBL4_9MARC